MTSKLQVTIPKVIARAHGIEPGCEVEFESADRVIHMRVLSDDEPMDAAAKLQRFDEATRRQAARNRKLARELPNLHAKRRGWSRQDLYDRGLAR